MAPSTCYHHCLLLHAVLPCALLLQSSHEVHTARLDALEDRLVGKEIGAANALADANNAWQEQRHRSVLRLQQQAYGRVSGHMPGMACACCAGHGRLTHAAQLLCCLLCCAVQGPHV